MLNQKCTTLAKISCAVLGMLAMLLVVSWSGGLKKTSDCTESVYLNPNLECGYEPTVSKKEYREFRGMLMQEIDAWKQTRKVSNVSVWFRDLEFGPTFGISERRDFTPASLLKLPLVLTFLSLAEDDPHLLERVVSYSEQNPTVLQQVTAPPNSIVFDRSYTIKELIEYAIVDSDNNASQLLYEYLLNNYADSNPLHDTYRDLGILDPGADINTKAVSAKGYAAIFRLLYNASFLDREASEYLLTLLAESKFQEGLRVGVPTEIAIAHKFGERTFEGGVKQLHDCGVVYFPGNPYLLCIMTEGTDFAELKGVIQTISKQVYDEFNSRRL